MDKEIKRSIKNLRDINNFLYKNSVYFNFEDAREIAIMLDEIEKVMLRADALYHTHKGRKNER